MRNFRTRLARAEARINRAFAEDVPAYLLIGDERRAITVIFERPDRSVELPAGGEIEQFPPAMSALTADITGLRAHCTVELNNAFYRVTHVGADEEGRTRVLLTEGAAGQAAPAVPGGWVKK